MISKKCILFSISLNLCNLIDDYGQLNRIECTLTQNLNVKVAQELR